jgi:lipopolysaccharide transport system ATP-binding protein
VSLVDEVLAVGDIGFVIKCLSRVRKMPSEAAVILVSHQMQFVSSFCTRVVFMDHGRSLVDTTQVSDAIDHYFGMIKADIVESGIGGARYKSIKLMGADCVRTDAGVRVRAGSEVFLEVDLELDAHVDSANLHFTIINEAMMAAACFPVQDESGRPQIFPSGKHQVRIDLGRMELRAGKYDFIAIVRDGTSRQIMQRIQGLVPFRVIDEKTHWGQIIRPAHASARP